MMSTAFMRVCARLSLRSLRASLCRVASDRWRSTQSVKRVAQPAAQAHVGLVSGAQAVPVHQQYRLAVQVDHARVGQQRASGLAAERLANEEVAIAVHQVDARTAVGHLAQGLGDGALEGVHAVVADPGFEEVAEDVQGLGPAGALIEERQKRPGDVRAFRSRCRSEMNRTLIASFFDDFGLLDDHVLGRHVLVAAAHGGGHALDLAGPRPCPRPLRRRRHSPSPGWWGRYG